MIRKNSHTQNCDYERRMLRIYPFNSRCGIQSDDDSPTSCAYE